MPEQEALLAAVKSLSSEVHRLEENIPDVYISKAEVSRLHKRIRLWQTLTAAVVVLVGLVGLSFRAFDQEQRQRFMNEGIDTDRAFCITTNQNRTEINKNRDSARKAYTLALTPRPGSSPEEIARVLKLREDLLATIEGNLRLLDCSGIGNGETDFSIQDAIKNGGTVPTP